MQAYKIIREWNGRLESFSLAQGIENTKQYFLLRTDVSQKPSLDSPDKISPMDN